MRTCPQLRADDPGAPGIDPGQVLALGLRRGAGAPLQGSPSKDPAKRWKLSPIDIEARARWVDYAEAKDEMFAYTDTKDSPWFVVEADDKRTARLNLIAHLLDRFPYERVDREKIELPAAPGPRLRPPAGRHPDLCAGALRRQVGRPADGVAQSSADARDGPRASRRAAAAGRAAGSRAGSRPGAGRGLAPAASAAPTCTSSTASCREPKLPLVPGHQIVGTVVAAGEGAERFAARRARRRPLARLDRRRAAATAASGRENLCDARPLHRLRPRRRLRRAGGRRRALLLPDPRRLPRPAGGAAALRRADRLPGAAPGRRGASGSASTASAPPRTSSARSPSTRAAASSPSPARATRRPRPSPASWAPSGPAPPTERAARAARRRDHLRRRRRAGAGGARGSRQGRAGGLRRHPHERHPLVPLRDPLGERALGSVANLTRADGEEFLALAPQVPVRTEVDDLPAGRRRTRRSPTCAPVASAAPRCWRSPTAIEMHIDHAIRGKCRFRAELAMIT